MMWDLKDRLFWISAVVYPRVGRNDKKNRNDCVDTVQFSEYLQWNEIDAG